MSFPTFNTVNTQPIMDMFATGQMLTMQERFKPETTKQAEKALVAEMDESIFKAITKHQNAMAEIESKANAGNGSTQMSQEDLLTIPAYKFHAKRMEYYMS